MIFRQFRYDDTGCAAYVLGCGGKGVAAVVDPLERDVEAYLSFAASTGLRIAHVIDTHVHADHRSGGRAVAGAVRAPYRLHRSADVTFPFEPLEDRERIVLGNTLIEVIHTPGHSPESVCLLVTDLRRGPEPWFLLTGDTLFVGGVGRPDLPGHAEADAARLFGSLHERLLVLPDSLEVYPGHFAGSACGKALSGKPSTTLGFERRFNPLLALDREAFVTAIADVPAEPAGFRQIVAFNRGLAEAHGA